MVGMSFSSLAPASLGLFIEPLSEEFGWKRAQISLGLTIYALFAVPFSPLAGALIDRRGSRGIAIPGLLLTACAFASFSFANESMTRWIGLWVFYAIVAMAVKSTVWTAAVSGRFSASRGLALAVVFCGTAISQTASPLLARWLIDDYGWRQAYIWMGVGWGGAALLLVVLFLTNPRSNATGSHAGSMPKNTSVLTGLSFKEALRSAPLRKIAGATVLISTLVGALIVHQVPILTERGLTREHAAWLAAVAGFASLFGKLCTGYLFDRSRSGWIGLVSLSLPALGCALLLLPNVSGGFAVAAIAILGYTAGAYLQLCTYLTTRYGGLRHYGKVFGVMASLLAFGTGVGPVLGGLVFDSYGSYALLLILGIPGSLLAGFLVARLGPYPEFHEPVDVESVVHDYVSVAVPASSKSSA
jgi:predicted MFS family arabinose efflux permease